MFHHDFGREVGVSDLVEIDEGDEIIYAKRNNREEYTVFNKSKLGEPSSFVTVALEAKEDGTYELASTWVGASDSPSFPGTELEQPNSKDYWSKHALVWGRQEIQPGTETTARPW